VKTKKPEDGNTGSLKTLFFLDEVSSDRVSSDRAWWSDGVEATRRPVYKVSE